MCYPFQRLLTDVVEDSPYSPVTDQVPTRVTHGGDYPCPTVSTTTLVRLESLRRGSSFQVHIPDSFTPVPYRPDCVFPTKSLTVIIRSLSLVSTHFSRLDLSLLTWNSKRTTGVLGLFNEVERLVVKGVDTSHTILICGVPSSNSFLPNKRIRLS